MPSEAHDAISNMIRQNGIAAAEKSDGKLDLQAARDGMEAMTALSPLPEGWSGEETSAGGVPAEWVKGAETDPARVVLYLHGGGYVLGSINTHRALAARIAQASGTRSLVIDYRLAPEHPFPAAVDDATAAYDWLLGQGVAPECVAIGGDSAGGGLTFATLVALKERGRPLPGAAFALSPWIDLEGLGESMTTKAEADPMVQKDGLSQMSLLYAGQDELRNPLAAPLYADLSGLPPMLVQVGTAETLLDDSIRIVDRMREAGGEVELETYEDLIHVFQAFAPAVPESLDAIERIGAFLKRSL